MKMPSPTRAKKKSAPRAKMPASRTFKVIAGGKEPVRSGLFNAARWQVPESRKTLDFKPSAANNSRLSTSSIESPRVSRWLQLQTFSALISRSWIAAAKGKKRSAVR